MYIDATCYLLSNPQVSLISYLAGGGGGRRRGEGGGGGGEGGGGELVIQGSHMVSGTRCPAWSEVVE